MARRGSHLLALSLSGGEVHHQDPLHLRCGLVSWRHTQLNHDSRFLTDELASSWRCLLLGYGLPNKGLRLLSPVMSVTSRRREARFWLQRCRPWRNRHRGLSGQSVLHLWCGCDRSERSPCAMPSGRGEAKAPLPTWHLEEFLGGVPSHGPLRG
jgi:hypothetical protein